MGMLFTDPANYSRSPRRCRTRRSVVPATICLPKLRSARRHRAIC